ncbi:MAG: hypothetical protein KF680_07035 [Cryobacterium sp.]|nr:hypothetical protein [Cryobacterium sp.]
MSRQTDASSPAPASGAATGAVSAASRDRRNWIFWTVVALFAVLYAQDLFQAVTDAFGVPADLEALNALRAEAELPPIAVPWVPIIVNLALPPLVFGAALVISWRRSALVTALVFATGLGLVAVLTLDMYMVAGLLVT